MVSQISPFVENETQCQKFYCHLSRIKTEKQLVRELVELGRVLSGGVRRGQTIAVEADNSHAGRLKGFVLHDVVSRHIYFDPNPLQFLSEIQKRPSVFVVFVLFQTRLLSHVQYQVVFTSYLFGVES